MEINQETKDIFYMGFFTKTGQFWTEWDGNYYSNGEYIHLDELEDILEKEIGPDWGKLAEIRKFERTVKRIA